MGNLAIPAPMHSGGYWGLRVIHDHRTVSTHDVFRLRNFEQSDVAAKNSGDFTHPFCCLML
ncbi:hypothetical protein BOTBODRAFT_265597 [Botryobasidium botryosum FD-172 SS1]|uniref:Uncharacterized protein n=1 Tax=Botryobasidium botryosum (strain FD-172 SS1) TaxID=930990 RepID=A0A067MJQ5_BOTB1|nr:hypothetical protein BOTBODRAFT_265597 [Botryobasidium botryosum FD-172 SS1]